jgi:PAS domain S-box-containing protein
MSDFLSIRTWLRDPQLAAHATSPLPVWVFTTDGARILWANAVAAAIFDAGMPSDLAGRRFDGQQIGAQIERIACTLPPGGVRLERLRGFGAGFGRTLVCACSRIAPGGEPGILIAATQPAGPSLSVAERVRRLLAPADAAVAAFTREGELLHATQAATAKLGAAPTLARLELEASAASALQSGHSTGHCAAGTADIDRIGSDANAVLILSLTSPAKTAGSPPIVPAVEPPEAPPTAAETVEPPATRGEPGERPTLVREEETRQRAPADIAAEPPAPRKGRDDGETAAERRFPLRFVWQMDADGRFSLGSDEFTEIIGARIAAALGRPWSEIAQALGVDPEGRVAHAIASRNTWSGITVPWPVDGADEPLMVEMSGLPIFDRDRTFRGYRGFGVCRDLARLSQLMLRRRAAPAAPQPAGEAGMAQTKNVVRFPSAAGETRPARLNEAERSTFREIGRELSARLKGLGATAAAESREETAAPPSPPAPAAAAGLIDRLPFGILIYRLDQLLYANRPFLEWTGTDSLESFAAAGGLDTLFIESGDWTPAAEGAPAKALTVSTQRGGALPAEARLISTDWDGDRALALVILGAAAEDGRKDAETALRRLQAENRELTAILDTATDGVVLLDAGGKILACNRSADMLFGADTQQLAGDGFDTLFAPESRAAALDYFERVKTDAVRRDSGREFVGRRRSGESMPLFARIGRISEGRQRYCAVFRDISPWKSTDDELVRARSIAEEASAAKSEFLAKVSHEIRTPLNTIIGFSEVMLGERFGPVGNERYLEYLKDIQTSGQHLLSLVNDLLDLSKIEAGKLELSFTGVNLNELAQQSVAMMQPQANRERVIIRMSLSQNLPQVVADVRSVRQIILNLLSNSIKFTGAGGQVIVSTAVNDDGEALLRVRDTGVGMNEKDLQTALEPFRQLATATHRGAGGTGLGLPLTKALTEANRATFNIKSAVDSGTLVEIAFPPARAVAS